MTPTAITYLVAACAGVFSLAAYTAWVAIPAWTSYSRVWQRVVAVVLSLYVLLAFAAMGFAAGVGVILLWDRFT